MILRPSLMALSALLIAQVSQGALFVPDLAPGSKYHLTFLTDNTTSAVLDSLEFYDGFVNDDADSNADLKDIDWFALVTAVDAEGETVDAVTHVAIKGPVYRIDGQRVAQNSSDVFNGSIEVPINVTPDGQKNVDSNVWTGSGSNGKATTCKDIGGGSWGCAMGFADPDGQTMGGVTNATNKDWITGNEMSWTRKNPIYAVSMVLTVPDAPNVPGDFDGNGTVDVGDINALGVALRAGSTDLKFDLDKSGTVTSADADYLFGNIMKVWLGDSNLDKQFNTSDLVTVFAVGEYEDAVAGNSTWAEGDWNLDGDFNTGDLVAAFAQGGYEAGTRPAIAAVPEPATGLTFALGALLLGAVRRRR